MQVSPDPVASQTRTPSAGTPRGLPPHSSPAGTHTSGLCRTPRLRQDTHDEGALLAVPTSPSPTLPAFRPRIAHRRSAPPRRRLRLSLPVFSVLMLMVHLPSGSPTSLAPRPPPIDGVPPRSRQVAVPLTSLCPIAYPTRSLPTSGSPRPLKTA